MRKDINLHIISLFLISLYEYLSAQTTGKISGKAIDEIKRVKLTGVILPTKKESKLNYTL